MSQNNLYVVIFDGGTSMIFDQRELEEKMASGFVNPNCTIYKLGQRYKVWWNHKLEEA